MENNQGLCITDTAETNYVVGHISCEKIENFFDITTESINGRLYTSFTEVTSTADDREKIFALKGNVNFTYNKTKININMQLYLVTISNYTLARTGHGYDLTVIDSENKSNKVKAWSLLDFQPLITGKKNSNTMLKELKELVGFEFKIHVTKIQKNNIIFFNLIKLEKI